MRFAGSELEFILFDETYESAHDKSWRGLRPANACNVDYSILGATMVEPCCGRSGSAWPAPGMLVKDSKSGCNFGQREVNLRYREALRMGDDHVVYATAPRDHVPQPQGLTSCRSTTSARATHATST